MTIEDLKAAAANVANELREGNESKELRARFVAIRAELFQRGIFDPVLVRFDSATVPQASPREIADELTLVASNL
jgi:DNA-directed RNA polymerase subunit K/omega